MDACHRSLYRFRLVCLAAIIPWIFILGSVGCTTLLGSQPIVQSYVLNATINPPKVSHPSDKVLLISEPRAEPGFDTPYIAYTEKPHALDYYIQSQWVDTPARMLLPLVVRAMEKSHAFKAVVIPPSVVPADLRLDIDLIRLQQDFLEHPSQVRLTLNASLINMDTNQVLGVQHFVAIEPAPSDNAYGGVQAANRAVAKVLEELVAFVLKKSGLKP
jgi:cholesterol transport system auxiliary component